MLGQGVIGQNALGQPEETGTASYLMAVGVGRFHLVGYNTLLGAGAFMYPAAGAFVLSSVGITTKITMQVAPGAFHLTGKPVVNQLLATAPGAFVISRHDASLTYMQHGIIAGTGVFLLTGVPITTKITLLAGTGTFILSGIQSGLLRIRLPLSAAAAAFVLTGKNADLQKGKFLVAAPGGFVLTGHAAGALLTMPVGTGVFTLSGNAAGSLRTVPSAAGAFALTGVAATAVFTRQLGAAPGHYVLVGVNAGLSQQLGAAPGALVVTPRTITMTYQRNGLLPAAGEFVWTGSDARAVWTRKLFAGAGAFLWTGKPAAPVRTRAIVAAAGAFSLTGVNAGLSQQLGAARGGFALAPGAVRLLYDRRLAAAPGAFSLVGGLAAANRGMLVGTGAFVVTGQPATLSRILTQLIAGTGHFIWQPKLISFNEESGVAAMRWQLTARARATLADSVDVAIEPDVPDVDISAYPIGDILGTVEEAAVTRMGVSKTATAHINVQEVVT